MRLLLLVSILTLGACAGQPAATLPTAWARADRQPVNGGLLDIDSLDCKDGMQKPEGTNPGNADKGADSRAMVDKAMPDKAMVDDFVSCMRERGYVQIKS